MRDSKKVRFALAVGLAFVIMLGVGVADSWGQDSEYKWLARAHYVHVWPGSDTLRVENPPGQTPPIFTEFSTDGGNGFGAELEYLFRPNIGVWAGLDFTNMKTTLNLQQGSDSLFADDRVDMRQLNLGGNYHFTPDRRADFYAGLLVQWVNYSSSTFNFSQVDQDYRVEYDSELSWGLNAGVDIPFGEDSSWFGTVAARYLFLALEGDNGIYASTIDPFQGYFGIGYRWW
ncbi:MAG: hypothetical protein WBP34_07880 [Thermoanaerobaculia bacterium]